MGCIEQHRFCNPRVPNLCTPYTAYLNFQDTPGPLTTLNYNPTQLATAERIAAGLEITLTYNSVNNRRGAALLASQKGRIWDTFGTLAPLSTLFCLHLSIPKTYYQLSYSTLNLRMPFSQRLLVVMSLAFPQIVTSATIVTTSKSPLTGSHVLAQSYYCAAIASSCPFAQTGEFMPNPSRDFLLTTTRMRFVWCNYACSDQGSCCGHNSPQSCLVAANLQDPCINMENSVILCTATADADCLCYDSAGNYNPSSFDNMVQSCSQFASSASPNLMSLLTGPGGSLMGYCTDFAGPNTSPATTSSGSSAAVTSNPSTTAAQTGGLSSVASTSTVSQDAKKSIKKSRLITSQASATSKSEAFPSLQVSAFCCHLPGYQVNAKTSQLITILSRRQPNS
jgi:hypothetical protein